ncbi:MAG: UDP-N-acetylmuramate--L-alanine ligase [Verrucomicrobia bacterium]|nr:UDP-N-acetylmuramate--L-alanine ligase [Verrucomicrobiota bacterium]
MNYHLVGIGGIGMSALARLLLDTNETVSGSDKKDSPLLASLRHAGVQVDLQQKGELLSSHSTVVYSTAVAMKNPEIARAQELGCTLLHRSELLAKLMCNYKRLAVTGTHGKTTTSALLAWVLLSSGFDPSFALGGILPPLGRNGQKGQGPHFVVEADESDGSFLKCAPYAAIVTNVEAEHLDQWKNVERLKEAFEEFFTHVEGPLVLCADDPFLQGRQGITYGFSSHAQHQITDFQQEGFSIRFHLSGHTLSLPLIGRHNALNGAAVFLLCRELGLSAASIQEAFSTFPGVARRLEKKGEVKGALFFDDYAHHPTEIKTTLEGLRAAIGERRLIAIFQPHRYTRTRDCWEALASAFEAADQVVVTEIYSAGEEPIVGVTQEALIDLIPQAVTNYEVRPWDVVITLGAGDVTHRFDQLPEVKKLRLGLLCGGSSPEHEISLASARNFQGALREDLYDVEFFPISRSQKEISDLLPQLLKCDLFLPIFHGPQGEDGVWAALFELLGKPYVGPDFRACSIAMDKGHTKKIAASAGVPTLPSFELEAGDPLPSLPWPITFVKPVHLGSSIGVSRVTSDEEFVEAVQRALKLDNRVIIEKGIRARDIEVAVLGNRLLRTPPPGEVLTGDHWYDYAGKAEGTPTPTQTVANLSPELAAQAQKLAKQVFHLLGCRGFARVDFLLDETGALYLNEVNPIPGFTAISLYPKMWEAAGMPLADLLDQFIQLGLSSRR